MKMFVLFCFVLCVSFIINQSINQLSNLAKLLASYNQNNNNRKQRFNSKYETRSSFFLFLIHMMMMLIDIFYFYIMNQELDDYVACCGFWAINDWLQNKVSEECEEDNVKQVQHISGLVEPQIRQHCTAYERGSFTCRMLVIMPLVMIILIILTSISLCICAHVSFYKWIQVRRKYRRVVNLQSQADESILSSKMLNEKRKNLNNDYDHSTRYPNRP